MHMPKGEAYQRVKDGDFPLKVFKSSGSRYCVSRYERERYLLADDNAGRSA
jgi:hypothetical protein